MTVGVEQASAPSDFPQHRVVGADERQAGAAACSIRVSTSVFERIWRIVRMREYAKFFVFNV